MVLALRCTEADHRARRCRDQGDFGRPGLPVIFETIGIASSLDAGSGYCYRCHAFWRWSCCHQYRHHVGRSRCACCRFVGKTTGKYYFEITNTTVINYGGSGGFGIGTPVSTYVNIGGSATTGVVVYGLGSIWSGGSNTGLAIGSSVGVNPELTLVIAISS